MTRLADGRSTHLTADEIAREVLRQYDKGPGEPSIRSIAAELKVTPNAIYHYFPSRHDLTRAAINLVWEEVIVELFERLADPIGDQGDPLEFFVICAVTTRRTFGLHPTVATHLSMVPTSDTRLAGAMAIIGSAFEQLGVSGEEAGLAFYSYLTYLVGSILIEASREIEARFIAEHGTRHDRFSSAADRPPDAPAIADETARALDDVLGLQAEDRGADESLFVAGLRRLLSSFRPADA